MRAEDEVIARGVPAPFWKFLDDFCRLPRHAFRPLAERDLPEPAKSLLVHGRDMTSTLATFHRSPVRVDLIQRQQLEGLYLREVYLRTETVDQIVEYGVIAIALDRFTREQQAEIEAGRTPLGGLLHKFQIPFESSPLSFVAVATGALPDSLRAVLNRPTCFGRFNRLTKPGGEPLAWILEILPP